MAQALRSSADPAVMNVYRRAHWAYLELYSHGPGPDARTDPQAHEAWSAAYLQARSTMRAAERAWVDAACATVSTGQLALF
jgi:hypothetical protein